uniref:Phospholipid/glycerol acyltransferase domain-containing protein n=3 Tax=Parascaris univalens TaxID=6257 RepID=A0A915C8L6_PARUN
MSLNGDREKCCLMGLLRTYFRPLLGPIFGVTILLTSIFGAYIITLILPILLLGKHQTWRSTMDRAISFWMIIPVTFLEYIFGVAFTVTGDPIDSEKPALVIMNHRTRLDWMYFWSAIFKINPWLMCSSKISLKEQLRKLPGAGFGMAANHFIFLQRHIDEDKRRFSNAIDYYVAMRRNYQILLFPEGTDKSPWTSEKSREYAKKNGLRDLKNVIYPRSAGITYLITKMRQCNYISCIYDVTVAYPVNVVQSEIDLVLKGQCPEKVHFDIRRIDISQVPQNEHDIAEWLNRLWIMKDEKLTRYYSLPPSKREFSSDAEKFIWEEADQPLHRITKLFSFWFWMVVIGTYCYHVTFLLFTQLVTLYSLCAIFIMQFIYGGIDHMVYYRWKKASSNKTISRTV